MIYITGDTHGTNDIRKIEELSHKNLNANDYLIILGDFGLLWNNIPDEKEENLKSFYNSLPCPVLWIDGNHENFERIAALPQTEMFGGKVGLVTPRIIHLERGEVYTIDNRKFFTMGGGISIDRRLRTPYVSWWPEELPSHKDYENALNNLKKNNYTVDYILTHEAPYRFHVEAYNHIIEYDLIHFLETEVRRKVHFTDWFFGHHHMDERIDDNLIAVYNQIHTI